MIERFFDELRRIGLTAEEATEPSEPNKNQRSQDEADDESFLAVVPTIRNIVWRRLFSSKRDDAPDIVQKVILQLLTWRKKNPDKIEEMTAEEWQLFAFKAAHHAAKKRLTESESLIEPLDDENVIADPNNITGNTPAEVASLALPFWQGICELSLRQRRALLLGSESLIVILRLSGVSSREITDVLEVGEGELPGIITRLPLKDVQIARLIATAGEGGSAKKLNIGSLTKSIKKARHEARARLKKLLSE